MLREFWSRVRGPIHPDDMPFREALRGFELDHPPPAYIGNPEAPIVILLANGGISRPGEFDAPGSEEKFYSSLRSGQFELADQHGSKRVQAWVSAGLAVRVNSVAYRSKRLSREPENRRVAEHLPSVALHRRWLREVILPEAHADRRFVIAHRKGVWGLDRKADAAPNIVFTPNPVGSAPAHKVLDLAEAWLRRTGRL